MSGRVEIESLIPVQEAVEFPQKLHLAWLGPPHAHATCFVVAIPLFLIQDLPLAPAVGTDYGKEGLLNVSTQLCTRLNEAAAQLLGQTSALEGADFAACVEIALVSN